MSYPWLVGVSPWQWRGLRTGPAPQGGMAHRAVPRPAPMREGRPSMACLRHTPLGRRPRGALRPGASMAARKSASSQWPRRPLICQPPGRVGLARLPRPISQRRREAAGRAPLYNRRVQPAQRGEQERSHDPNAPEDAVARGYPASRPWMACVRALEPGMAEPRDAGYPRAAAAPSGAGQRKDTLPPGGPRWCGRWLARGDAPAVASAASGTNRATARNSALHP